MEMIRWGGMDREWKGREGGKGIDTVMVMRGEKGDERWREDEKRGRGGEEDGWRGG